MNSDHIPLYVCMLHGGGDGGERNGQPLTLHPRILYANVPMKKTRSISMIFRSSKTPYHPISVFCSFFFLEVGHGQEIFLVGHFLCINRKTEYKNKKLQCQGQNQYFLTGCNNHFYNIVFWAIWVLFGLWVFLVGWLCWCAFRFIWRIYMGL